MPGDLRARAFDPATGRAELELAGQWRDVFRPLQGRALTVQTNLLDSHILASCVIPAALLPLP